MLWQRTKGLQNTLLLCQMLLAAALMCVVMLVMGVERLPGLQPGPWGGEVETNQPASVRTCRLVRSGIFV
jgi:hypothetical protein